MGRGSAGDGSHQPWAPEGLQGVTHPRPHHAKGTKRLALLLLFQACSGRDLGFMTPLSSPQPKDALMATKRWHQMACDSEPLAGITDRPLAPCTIPHLHTRPSLLSRRGSSALQQ